jgi:hypothetical protein
LNFPNFEILAIDLQINKKPFLRSVNMRKIFFFKFIAICFVSSFQIHAEILRFEFNPSSSETLSKNFKTYKVCAANNELICVFRLSQSITRFKTAKIAKTNQLLQFNIWDTGNTPDGPLGILDTGNCPQGPLGIIDTGNCPGGPAGKKIRQYCLKLEGHCQGRGQNMSCEINNSELQLDSYDIMPSCVEDEEFNHCDEIF